MDRLRWMETFVRVVESGNFSVVARQYHTTQSAISKQIQALENEVGAMLLVRSTRSHALTEAGALYFQRCRQILETLEEAKSEVHRAEHEVSGLIRVAAPMAFARLHIVPRLPAFYARYPKIRIDLQLDDRFVDLIASGIDVTFRVGELKDSRLIARRIGTVSRAVMASQEYLAKHGEPATLDELAHHNCLLYTGVDNFNEWTFHPLRGGPRVIRVNSNFQSNSSEAIRQALLEGLGIIYSPSWIYGDELRTGKIKILLPQYKPSSLPLNVVFQPSRKPSLKINCVVDYFTE
ncbi:LysR family transcriptional regulator, partial [Limnobacter sp.]|uniref:LysR family transcriptional regulator n=1 Tax=Limnobacter sp. TaxID=2003368 RepID=UPI003515C109